MLGNSYGTTSTTVLEQVKEKAPHENGNISKKDDSKKHKPVKYLGGLLEFRTRVVWFNAFGFLMLHILTLYSIYYMGLMLCPPTISFLLHLAYHYFIILCCNQGITSGVHRLFTHRAYKAKMPLRILLATFQTWAGQNCIYTWVRDHRLHHKHADTDADPHNARRGFFFSHIGWLMMKKHPEILKKKDTIDLSDLHQDPVVMFQKEYYYSLFFLNQLFLMAVPYYLLGRSAWEVYLLNVLRYVIFLHGTWSVNSFAHFYGTKPYDKNILSAENKIVSILTNGEGWHNYHHCFPWDYKASEFGAAHNFSTTFIEFFAKIGQASDLKVASEEMVLKRLTRTGDGSYILKTGCFEKASDKVDPAILKSGW